MSSSDSRSSSFGNLEEPSDIDSDYTIDLDEVLAATAQGFRNETGRSQSESCSRGDLDNLTLDERRSNRR